MPQCPCLSNGNRACLEGLGLGLLQMEFFQAPLGCNKQCQH